MSSELVLESDYSKIKQQVVNVIDLHTIDNYPHLTLEDLKMTSLAYSVYHDGNWAGGITGEQKHTELFISSLAVKKEYRKYGYGEQLLKAMEEKAKENDMTVVTLSTLSYQALPFYERQGYKVFGKLEDLPREGVTRYYLYKRV